MRERLAVAAGRGSWGGEGESWGVTSPGLDSFLASLLGHRGRKDSYLLC